MGMTASDHAMRHVRQIHLVGIGGSGMCGIAEVLLNLGYEVSGSDISATDTTRRLEKLGIPVYTKHCARNIRGSDAVVVSSAIANDNVEIVAAHNEKIPVIPRAIMLGELMRHRFGIAIAGTHGKTTTTSMVTQIFQAAGFEPTYVIGGLLKSDARHANLGASKYLIAEADESDASFLHLQPMLAIVTNIDRDHMETFDFDREKQVETFRQFIDRLPFYGAVVVCIDDVVLREMTANLSRPVLSYGFSKEADFRATDIQKNGANWSFRALRPHPLEPLAIALPIPGNQNVLNALAAVATATDEGISGEAIEAGLAGYTGVGRRFETTSMTIDGKSIVLVDDYGHHPTEIKAVVETARDVWPDCRLFMVFQPHRYTRTRDLFAEFVGVLTGVEELVLLSTYAAGEDPISGASIHQLANALDEVRVSKTRLATDCVAALTVLREHVCDGDVVLVQGAGNVNQISSGLRSLTDD